MYVHGPEMVLIFTIFGWININDINYYKLFDMDFLWIPRVVTTRIADETRDRLMDS